MANSTRYVVAILMVGCLIRVVYSIQTGLNKPPVSDEWEYHLIARNLVEGKGFRGISWGNPQEHPTAYRAPALPFVWSLMFRVFGYRADVLRLFNVVCDVVSLWLMYLIGRWLFTERAGLLAAGWLAVWPVSIFLSGMLLAESLSVTLQLASIYLCFRAARDRKASLFLLGGLLFGLAVLTRPNLLLALPCLALWAVVLVWPKWSELPAALLVFALAVFVVALWTYRNYRVFGRFVPVVTTTGSTLLMGNNDITFSDPKSQGRDAYEDHIPGFNEAVRGLGEDARDSKAKELAIAWLKANPDKWGKMLWYKFRRFCLPTLEQPGRAKRLAMMLSWGPVFLLGSLGLVVTARTFWNRREGYLLHWLVLSSIAGMLIVYVIPRYRYPVEPLFILMAAATVDWLMVRFRRDRVVRTK